MRFMGATETQVKWIGEPNYVGDHSLIYHPPSDTIYIGAPEYHHSDLSAHVPRSEDTPAWSNWDANHWAAAVDADDFFTYDHEGDPAWNKVHSKLSEMHNYVDPNHPLQLRHDEYKFGKTANWDQRPVIYNGSEAAIGNPGAPHASLAKKIQTDKDSWFGYLDGDKLYWMGTHGRELPTDATQVVSQAAGIPVVSEDGWKFASGEIKFIHHTGFDDEQDKMNDGGPEENGWGGRIPLVYTPDSNTIHVGEPDVPHYTVAERAKAAGHDTRLRSHGWVGYNPEAEDYDLDGADNYGWYDHDHITPEVEDAVAKHFNINLHDAPEDMSTWMFSKVAVEDKWEYDEDDLQPWKPGTIGKGLFDTDGNVHTWEVSRPDGGPVHSDAADLLGVNSEHNSSEFWINHQGDVSFWKPRHIEPRHNEALRAIGLNPGEVGNMEVPEEWHFGKVATREWAHLAPEGLPPYEGKNGKGVFTAAGQPEIWGVDEYGLPGHERWPGQFDELDNGWRTSFHIVDGKAYSWHPEDWKDYHRQELRHIGLEPDESERAGWRFSNLQPGPNGVNGGHTFETGFWSASEDGPSRPWSPGTNGKGYIDRSGTVHIWGSGGGRDPHHPDFADFDGEDETDWGESSDPNSVPARTFAINPDGTLKASIWSGGGVPNQEKILAAHPYLKPPAVSDQTWKFGKTADISAFFSPPHDKLNPIFWENEKLKPELHDKLIEKWNFAFSDYPGLADWSALYVIGSATSYQYDDIEHGGDFDLQMVVDEAEFKKANPSYADKDWTDIRGELHQTTVSKVDGDELTDGISMQIFVRPENTFGDFLEMAKNLKQGVYDVEADNWVVEPFKLPKDFDLSLQFADWQAEAVRTLQKGEDLLAQYEFDKSDTSKQALKDFYGQLHQGRQDAFAGEGGQFGKGNFIWQYFVNFGPMHAVKEAIGGYTLSRKADYEAIDKRGLDHWWKKRSPVTPQDAKVLADYAKAAGWSEDRCKDFIDKHKDEIRGSVANFKERFFKRLRRLSSNG